MSELSLALATLANSEIRYLGEEAQAAVRNEGLRLGQSFFFLALISLIAGATYATGTLAFFWWAATFMSSPAAMGLTTLVSALLAGSLWLGWKRL